MTITIPQEQMGEVDTLVHQWQKLASTTLCPLHSMLGKLFFFFMTQCCPPARFFLNRMLETLRACPAVGRGQSPCHLDFKKTLIGLQLTLQHQKRGHHNG